MSPPNIIFLVLDTLRADKILGNFKNISLMPFLKSLLEKSYYFEKCITNTTWTLPSHISMFTGLYQTQNEIISGEIDVLSNRIPVITEILKELGYSTFCYSENPFISSKYGLIKGFDTIFNSWKMGNKWWWWIKKKDKFTRVSRFLEKVSLWIKKITKNNLILRVWDIIKFRIDNLIRFIQKQLFWENILSSYKNNTLNDIKKFYEIIQKKLNSKPLYLYFNLMATHDPYIPLKNIFDLFDITNKDFKTVKEFILNMHKFFININMRSKHLSRKKSGILKKLYDASVYYCDLIIKRIYSYLEKFQLLDNSYIIITSDHGEHLFDKEDHYLWGHQTCLSGYKAVTNVPLIIMGPNIQKKRIQEQVQLKDLFHTILDMTGIKKTQNLYLKSEMSIIHQYELKTTPKYIFGEHIKSNSHMTKLIRNHRRSIKKNLIRKIFNNLYFLRSNQFKYIKYQNINMDEFYDLRNDPNEQNNIFDMNNSECRKMATFLETLLTKIKDLGEIKDIITKKEKNSLKIAIRSIKIRNI